MIVPLFNERLKSLMEEFNVDINTLSKSTKIYKKTIQSWLDNKTKPSVKHLIVLKHFFKKSCDYIVGLSKE